MANPSSTVAEGLATGTAFELPQAILRSLLDDFVLVEDALILEAVRHLLTLTKTLVEPAGAAPLAAALQVRADLQGRRVGLVCSGANIAPRQLLEVLQES